MTRGGKREGAGRPKNPKELNKKMCSFRLSKEEERAVRELLAKMRGKIITLFLLMSLCLPCYAEQLKASATITQEQAKIEAFKDVYQFATFPNTEIFRRSLGVKSLDTNNISVIQEFKTKLFKVIPYNVIGVVYKDLPNYAFYYQKSQGKYKGIALDILVSNKYPIKIAKYDTSSGKLISVQYRISPNDDFVYNAQGELIAMWRDGQEILNNSGTRNIIHFE